MAESVHMVVPEELAEWICRQQGCSRGDCQECRRRVGDEIARHAVRLARQVHRTPLAEGVLGLYATRLWRCMEYHWKRLSELQTIAFAQLAARLEAGDLGYERSSANVLLEITLAHALESRNQEAAMMFETEYIPFVTSIARRLGGQRAVNVFDNFTAELILPRADSSPRIAGYHGRTSLRSWLRAVVANLWVSRQRKREAITMNVLPEPEAADSTATLDHRPCVQLLRPLFRQAVGRLEAEDRLLIKMLLIDEVPQKGAG
jgi:DNA-directed RNA polymerase specialized sigma24 family protein